MKIFVTGGAKGIGKEIAEYFAGKGAEVAITYYKSKEKAEKFGFHAFYADVKNFDELAAAYFEAKNKLGGIDVVVANSGIAHFAQIQDCTQDDFDEIFNTNARGVFNLFKIAAKDMLSQKSGNMIAISSIFGENGASCESLYAASKGAVNSFVKSLAAELGQSNIRVNAVACGIIDTEMNARLTEQEKQDFAACTSLGRIGLPGEVAHAAHFLAANGYITGQIINIDGGW